MPLKQNGPFFVYNMLLNLTERQRGAQIALDGVTYGMTAARYDLHHNKVKRLKRVQHKGISSLMGQM